MKTNLAISYIAFVASALLMGCTDDSDTTAPVISELTSVATPSLNTTPTYQFNSSSVGEISYTGACQSDSIAAVIGVNSIQFIQLEHGSYSGCVINVTDNAGNRSTDLTVSDFTILPVVDVHQASIVFPIANSNLGGIEKMTVRGVIERTDSNSFTTGDVTSVLVNGQPASLLEDGSGQWSLVADVIVTTTELTAEITFADTSTQAVAIPVTNQAITGSINDFVYDKATQHAYITSSTFKSIVKIELATDQRTLLRPTDGNKLLDQPRVMALDSANNRLLIAEYSNDQLIQLDLDSGNQTLLSAVGNGSGSIWNQPTAIIYDADNNVSYLADSNQKSIYKINLITGDRTIVSSNAVGSGDNYSSITDIQLDLVNNQLFALDGNAQAVIVVDLTTGDRTTVSSSATPVGTGDSILYFTDLSYNSATGKLFAIDYKTVIEVDLANGNRSTFTEIRAGSNFDNITDGSICCSQLYENNNLLYIDRNGGALYKIDTSTDIRVEVLAASKVGTGEDIERPTGLTINPDNTTLYLADETSNAVFSLGITSGDRQYISGALKGIGDTFQYLRDIEYDQTNQRLLVVDDSTNTLVGINIISGDRTEVSGPIVGTGTSLSGIEGLTVDQNTATAYITDNNLDEVFKIDLATGDRRLFTGSGNPIPDPQAATFDHVNNRLYIADDREDQILAVDVSTGDRTDISSDLVGSGPDINIPQDISFDTVNNRIIMGDSSNDYLLAISPATGVRTELWSENVGNGMPLNGVDALTTDNDAGIVYVATGSPFTLWAVDLQSGDAVIMAH